MKNEDDATSAAPKPQARARRGGDSFFLAIGLFVAIGGAFLWQSRGLVRHALAGAANGDKNAVRLVQADGGSESDAFRPASGAIAADLAAKTAPAASASAVPTAVTPVVFAPPTHEHLDVGGLTRKYSLVVPSPLAAHPALVLVFHGDGGDGAGFHSGFAFERASQGNAVVAYPDGIDTTWTLGGAHPNRDVSFIAQLVDSLVARYGIDRTRVFAAGYSSGGFFVNVLACQKPGLLRAISSSAGGAPYDQSTKYPNGYPKCDGEKPVAMIALHDPADGTVTVDSGEFSAAYWAYANGCNTEERETTGYPECSAYRSCPKGQAVMWCVTPKVGHWVWGKAAEASWTFFQQAAAP